MSTSLVFISMSCITRKSRNANCYIFGSFRPWRTVL